MRSTWDPWLADTPVNAFRWMPSKTLRRWWARSRQARNTSDRLSRGSTASWDGLGRRMHVLVCSSSSLWSESDPSSDESGEDSAGRNRARSATRMEKGDTRGTGLVGSTLWARPERRHVFERQGCAHHCHESAPLSEDEYRRWTCCQSTWLDEDEEPKSVDPSESSSSSSRTPNRMSSTSVGRRVASKGVPLLTRSVAQRLVTRPLFRPVNSSCNGLEGMTFLFQFLGFNPGRARCPTVRCLSAMSPVFPSSNPCLAQASQVVGSK